jgi:DNA invertase Pin-like site-specific DNA recombinase
VVVGVRERSLADARTLKQAGVSKVFGEKASGGRWERPELQRLLEQLRKGDDVVWKLDRLSRFPRDRTRVMESIAAAGARFRSLTESVDTTSAAGRMLMQILGSAVHIAPNMGARYGLGCAHLFPFHAGRFLGSGPRDG